MQEPEPNFYAFTDLTLEVYDDFEIRFEGSSSEIYIFQGENLTDKKQAKVFWQRIVNISRLCFQKHGRVKK